LYKCDGCVDFVKGGGGAAAAHFATTEQNADSERERAVVCAQCHMPPLKSFIIQTRLQKAAEHFSKL